jgi:hypothetical protein
VGELIVRWALAIGFGLLGAVTALAAFLIVATAQQGNVLLLSITAIVSSAIAFFIWRGIRARR